jgi:hypothetical protein
MAEHLIKRINTATLVKVKAITSNGEVEKPGTMDITLLVNMLDGAGQVSKHGSVFKIIYCRPQSGDKAIIMDPKVGDMGLVVMCDRDTSAVRETKDQANPGSRRRFDMADGVWVCALMGEKPKVYVQFMNDEDGTVIVGNAKGDEAKPLELLVTKNYVQMKQKGKLDLHVTIDRQAGKIIMGQVAEIADDPNPGS